MERVLIADSDLNFAFWLGQTLDQAGYESLPARSIADATVLLAELKVPIDLLVLNPILAGAEHLADALRRLQRNRLKVVCVVEDSEDERSLAADAWRSKPAHGDELCRLEWLQAIQSLFGSSASGDKESSRSLFAGVHLG